ncbi:hypothetical protein ACUN9Y_09515 [Halomonas sp. V046]
MRSLILLAVLTLAGCGAQDIDTEYGHQHGYDAVRSMINSTSPARNGID